jgi:hypothetical protein
LRGGGAGAAPAPPPAAVREVAGDRGGVAEAGDEGAVRRSARLEHELRARGREHDQRALDVVPLGELGRAVVHVEAHRHVAPELSREQRSTGAVAEREGIAEVCRRQAAATRGNGGDC